MKRPTRLAILFNGAALLVVLASGAAVLRSVFMPDEVAPCSTRYSQGTQLSLERSRGELLTAADLQARFGGDDWGLLDNARVVALKGDPVKPAIEVRLAKVPGEASRANSRFGMGFTWMPKAMHQTSSACLTYSVLLPSDFDFAKGGRLPSLLTTAQSQIAGPTRRSAVAGARPAPWKSVRNCRDGPTPARWPVTAASMCCGADNGLRSSRRLCSTRPARRMA